MSKELKITRAEVINASNVIKDFCAKVEDCNDDCPFSIINPNGTWECGLMKDPSRWEFERFSKREKEYAKSLSLIGVISVVRLKGKLYCTFPGKEETVGVLVDVFPDISEGEVVKMSDILGLQRTENPSIF